MKKIMRMKPAVMAVAVALFIGLLIRVNRIRLEKPSAGRATAAPAPLVSEAAAPALPSPAQEPISAPALPVLKEAPKKALAAREPEPAPEPAAAPEPAVLPPSPPAPRIGVAAVVQGRVEISGATSARVIRSGDDLHVQDVVVTGPGGGLQIMLLDETIFTLGPDSSIVFEEFAFDSATDLGRITARVLKGNFKFITGRIPLKDSTSMSVKFPDAALDVHGTIVAGKVEPTGTQVVLLGPGPENSAGERAGAITVHNTAGSVDVTRPGDATSIGNPDMPPTAPAPTDSTALSPVLVSAPNPPSRQPALEPKESNSEPTRANGPQAPLELKDAVSDRTPAEEPGEQETAADEPASEPQLAEDQSPAEAADSDPIATEAPADIPEADSAPELFAFTDTVSQNAGDNDARADAEEEEAEEAAQSEDSEETPTPIEPQPPVEPEPPAAPPEDSEEEEDEVVVEDPPAEEEVADDAAEIIDGLASWDDVRTIEEGQGQYAGSGPFNLTLCEDSDCENPSGEFHFLLKIDFGEKTFGGNGSGASIFARDPNLSDEAVTERAEIPSQSFAELGNGLDALEGATIHGTSESGNLNVAIALHNQDGEAAATANATASYNDGDYGIEGEGEASGQFQHASEVEQLQEDIASWDNVRTIESGTGYYEADVDFNLAQCGGGECAGPQSQEFYFRLAIDFDQKTVGGNGSEGYVYAEDGNLPNGYIEEGVNIAERPFDYLAGDAVLKETSETGNLNVEIALKNEEGVAAARADATAVYDDTANVGAENASKGEGQASSPLIPDS